MSRHAYSKSICELCHIVPESSLSLTSTCSISCFPDSESGVSPECTDGPRVSEHLSVWINCGNEFHLSINTEFSDIAMEIREQESIIEKLGLSLRNAEVLEF